LSVGSLLRTANRNAPGYLQNENYVMGEFLIHIIPDD